MNDYTGYIIVAGYLGIWLLLFIASRFTPLSTHIIFPRKYWWLYIPFISWLFTVFPLVLPPIPMGPIQISLAWSRRRMFPFYKEGCELLGKQEKSYGFPWGWFVNLMINLWDMATLGLAQLFATASLLREMIQADGTDAERAEIDPLWWSFKWLLLGNVFFLAAYLACPGVIFAPLLTRMEKHYELHRTPSNKVLEEVPEAPDVIVYGGQDATPSNEVLEKVPEVPDVIMFDGQDATPSNEVLEKVPEIQYGRFYNFSVKCKRCSEIIEGQVNLSNDPSLEFDEKGKPYFICRKVLVGDKLCFQRIEVVFRFHKQRGVLVKQITGGEFVEG